MKYGECEKCKNGNCAIGQFYKFDAELRSNLQQDASQSELDDHGFMWELGHEEDILSREEVEKMVTDILEQRKDNKCPSQETNFDALDRLKAEMDKSYDVEIKCFEESLCLLSREEKVEYIVSGIRDRAHAKEYRDCLSKLSEDKFNKVIDRAKESYRKHVCCNIFDCIERIIYALVTYPDGYPYAYDWGYKLPW